MVTITDDNDSKFWTWKAVVNNDCILPNGKRFISRKVIVAKSKASLYEKLAIL